MMEKGEALSLFLEKEVKEASVEFVARAMDNLKKEERQKTVDAFLGDFRELFGTYRDVAEERGEMRFLQISLMRARALHRKPFYMLEAFGNSFYLEEPLVSGELGLDWLYREYYRFCDRIEQESRKYILKIDELMLDRIKLAELKNCGRIVLYLMGEALVYLLNMEEFWQLGIREGFQIHMAEYRGPFVKVLETDEYTKRLGRWWYGIL